MSDVVKSNCYELLGVSRDASKEQIRYAYKELGGKFHPDAPPTSEQNVSRLDREEMFRLVTEAYQTLISQERRSAYDASLTKGKRRPSEPERRGQFGRVKPLSKEHYFFPEMYKVVSPSSAHRHHRVYFVAIGVVLSLTVAIIVAIVVKMVSSASSGM